MAVQKKKAKKKINKKPVRRDVTQVLGANKNTRRLLKKIK